MTKRDKLSSPVVVLDWNLLRSMPASHDVPPAYACVVPDQVFHEIATTKSGDPDDLIRKFGTWAARNVPRLWYGRTKEDLVTRQWKCGGRHLSMNDIAHPVKTRDLRRFAIESPNDWPSFIKTVQSGNSIAYREQEINSHVMVCKRISDAWHKTYPGRSLTSIQNQSEWIRGPELVRPIVTELYYPRWRSEWTSTLADDPNRFAVVRWARFVGWYCMRHITGQTRKFENNFDDATYGLLASYTGHLGTNDCGLQHAAQAIFPGLRIADQQRLIEIPS